MPAVGNGLADALHIACVLEHEDTIFRGGGCCNTFAEVGRDDEDAKPDIEPMEEEQLLGSKLLEEEALEEQLLEEESMCDERVEEETPAEGEDVDETGLPLAVDAAAIAFAFSTIFAVGTNPKI